MTDEAAQDEETVLLVARKHWASLIPEVMTALVPIAILLALLFLSETETTFVTHLLLALVTPLGLLVAWIVALILWTGYYLNMLVVTDRRIFYALQPNMFDRSVFEWDIRDIKNVNVHIGNALESFFRFRTLQLVSSEGLIEVPGLNEPEKVSAVILKQDKSLGELKETARKQQELLKFISHEVKGHLTKSKAAFAAIVEGDMGPISASMTSLAQAALADTQQGVETVMSILEESDFMRGTVTYEKKAFDLSSAVARSVVRFKDAAEKKHLALDIVIDKYCAMVGDQEKIEHHVIRNLIDNAIRYTQSGRIAVSLKKMDGYARFSVTDTGVGVSKTDMQKLFTQGGHGEKSRTVNPESTGYGLFIAKQIVDAHNGRIWAHSEGQGRGSTFFVDLPISGTKEEI